jgi:alpha/beta superfamily hydrolase
MKNTKKKYEHALFFRKTSYIISRVLKNSLKIMNPSEPKKVKVNIYRPSGLIEGWCVRQPTSRCVVLLPPHPSYGGTIANGILKIINDAFVDVGFNTLRINFRGVGLSQGEVNNRSFDLQDALEALDWLTHDNNDLSCLWIGGFGYGGKLAIQASMRKPGLSGMVSVSPQISPMDFNSLTPCPGGLVVVAEQDQFINIKSVSDEINNLSKKKGSSISMIEIPNANHMYENQLPQLYKVIYDYVLEQVMKAESRVKDHREFG